MNTNQNYISDHFNKQESRINIRVEIEKNVRYWKYFVFGVVLSLILAFLYIRNTAPIYMATSTILIKDNKKAGLSTELEAFKDLGIVGGNSINNTDNEIEILKSRKVVGSVVDSLDLNIFYFLTVDPINKEVYRYDSPLNIKFVKKSTVFYESDYTLFLKPQGESSYSILSENGETLTTHQYNELIENDLGSFKIFKNESSPYKNEELNNVIIQIAPRYDIIDSYRARINITPVNQNSSVLVLTIKDPVPEKAVDVLNELVKQYNLDAINDKNQISSKTIEFINSRLKAIGKELALIDDEVESYKSDNDFTGLPIEIQLALESLKETSKDIIETKTQLSLAKWIEDKLKNNSTKFEILPLSLGANNLPSVTSSIAKYNEHITERDLIKIDAGPKNPSLLLIEEQIENDRSSLLGSLSNVSKSLDLKLSELNGEEEKIMEKVRLIPTNERGYLDISRQQKIKATLYSYLLKKKEETDISLAVTVPNAKIIDKAYSLRSRVSPRKKIIYLIAFLFGLLVPFVVIYLRDLLDTKIHHRKDVESEISVPFLGELPNTDNKQKVIIGNNNRSSSAEAFRLIRTNLDFILANTGKTNKTIFITSTMSGEGKSFISINVASILALSGKKVLLMGMDLRAPKITEYLEMPDRKGVTNYITDESLDFKSLLFQIPQSKDLDILASGTIPPNPAELLMTPAVDRLFDKVKREYDYIIVDTAPVNLVTDTLLIAKHADMFMYVVRANYLDKRLLAVPEDLYKQKKLPNMAIVLNDTNPKGRYGYGGYGYGGYGYGGYGYGGYGSYGNDTVQKPWYKKIFTKRS